MGLDRTRWAELLVGRERVEVLEVARASDGRVYVVIETTDGEMGCSGCGCRARVKDRDRVRLADLPVFGSPTTLVWLKRRWRCVELVCPVGSWTEDRPDIAPARAAMTSRAGQWATREVGAEADTVAYAAAQLGVAWHTVMDAVAYWGQALVEDSGRVGTTEAVGGGRDQAPGRQAASGDAVDQRDLRRGPPGVIDVIEGRGGPQLDAWLQDRPQAWREAVTATVTDLHEPFRQALAKHLTNATAVTDPFHVVAVGNRVVDRFSKTAGRWVAGLMRRTSSVTARTVRAVLVE